VVRIDGEVILDGPQAVLVSNNPYQTGDIAGLAAERGSARDCSASSASRSKTPLRQPGCCARHGEFPVAQLAQVRMPVRGGDCAGPAESSASGPPGS
jgi:hypothetical protein